MTNKPAIFIRASAGVRQALKILAAERGETMGETLAAIMAAVKSKKERNDR